MQNFMETIFNAFKHWVKETIDNNRSDWNASEWEPGYIANRTHYKGFVELVNETPTLTDEGIFMCSSEVFLTLGETYIVTYCGTKYTCVAWDFEGMTVLGNKAAAELEDTGEPFAIVNEGVLLGVMDLSGATEVTVKIDGPHYFTIPMEYLPNINHNMVNGSAFGSLRSVGAKSEDADYTMGNNSHAEGYNTIASGHNSHAEGVSTTASADVSHAEGSCTTASASPSHAEGSATTASGWCSHAEGRGTIASSNHSHVEGKYNIEDTSQKYAHIVGNGEDEDNRSNAHTLDWDGNAWYAGTVEGTAYIIRSSTPGSNKKFKLTIDDTGTLTITEMVGE